MKRGQKLAVTLALALPIAMTTPVFADTTTTATTTTTTTSTTPAVNDPFAAQYQKNLQAETTLLTQAQAQASASTQAAALIATAKTIQQQAASLFTVEQSMAATRASIPTVTVVNTDALKKLQQQRNDLVAKIKAEANSLKLFGNGKENKGHGEGDDHGKHGKEDKHGNQGNNNVNFGQLKKVIGTQMAQLAKIDSQIAKLQFKGDEDDDKNNNKLYDGGFKSLQDSILRTQAAVTNFLNEAIWIEAQSTTTTPQTTTPVAAPTSLAVSNLSSTGWTVSWTAATGATSYNVYVNGTKVASNVTGTSYAVSGATPSTNYNVTVTAVDASNNESSASTPLSVATSAPVVTTNAPTGVTVSNLTKSGLTVSWSAVTGATSYNVYLNGSKVANGVTGTSFDVSNLNPSTTYSVTVTAVGSNNTESTQSSPAVAITSAS